MTELRRELGIFSCTMLVAGNIIGIGIFVTPGRITNLLPDPKFILFAWIFGGLLSLMGALAYAELATRFPRAGGGYVYLREAFGPLFGFLSGFSSSLVTIPGTSAFLSIGFAKYVGITDPWVTKSVAVGLILFISAVNYYGVKWGAELQDLFMIIKLVLISALIVFGFFSPNGSFGNFAITKEFTSSIWVALPLAMIPIMYTYSGWDATVYVAGEVKNPTRTIPVSLFFGTMLVTLIYLALASLYLYAMPITTPVQTRIATDASTVLFGPTVGKVIGWMVAISLLGCLSATILTGPRIVYAMARDGLFLASSGEVHPQFATPVKAIWYQGIWSCFLVLTGTFDQLLDYVTVPSVFFAAIAAVGLFILRSKDKKDPGATPYLSFGYPVLPALFALSMGWIVVNSAIKSPNDSLWGLAIVALGVPIYFLVKKYSGAKVKT